MSDRFKKNIRKVNNQINAYYEDAGTIYGCIVLHEHLGLVQNIVKVTNFIIGPKFTVMIPDLFAATTTKTLLNNQFDGIAKLKYNHVQNAVNICLQFLNKKCKYIILVGFSTGAAFGLKIVQQMDIFKQAYLFYGLPNLDYIEIDRIKTECILFHGTEDKIKYLSDPRMYDHMINKSKDNKNIKFQQINGAQHGFMNPQSETFSQQTVKHCKKIILSSLPKEALAKDNQGDKKNKDDCIVF